MYRLYVLANNEYSSAGISMTYQGAKTLLRHFKNRFNTCAAIAKFSHVENISFALEEMTREAIGRRPIDI